MKKNKNKCCETCSNLTPIGEGDHICDAVNSDNGRPFIMPISEYQPTSEYFKCEGLKYDEN